MKRFALWLSAVLILIFGPVGAFASEFHCFTSTRVVNKLLAVNGTIRAATQGGLLVFSPDGNLLNKFTVEQGLPDLEALALAPTKYGVLTATRSGLAIVDGEVVRNLDPRPVFALGVHGEETWFGTESQLCRIGSPDPCRDIPFRPSDILVRGDVIYIASAGGLLRLKDENIETIILRDDALASMTTSLAWFNDRLWVGTADGLFSFDPRDGSIEEFTTAQGLRDTHITDLLPSGEKMYVASFNGGLAVISAQGIEALEGAPESITAVAVLNNVLWLGTPENGIYRMVQGKTPQQIRIDEPPDNNVTSIAPLGGKICVGTFNFGAACFQNGAWTPLPRVQGPRGDWVNHIAALQGRLYLRTSRGDLFVLDKTLWRRITTKDGIAKNWTSSVMTADDKLWAGTWGGIFKFDGTHWYTLAPKPQLRDQVITDAELFNGDLFVATAKGGVAVYRKNSRRWEVMNPATGFRDTWVTALEEFNGALWAGTFSRGLAKLNKKGEWTWFDQGTGALPTNRVFALAHYGDSLWIGTLEGLVRIRADKAQTFTRKQGLPHDTIQALAVSSGKLWIGTPSGFCYLDLK